MQEMISGSSTGDSKTVLATTSGGYVKLVTAPTVVMVAMVIADSGR
jgi:hypothetical protein